MSLLSSAVLTESALPPPSGSNSCEASAERAGNEPASAYREVRYEHSRNFPAVLEHLGISLLVSTYQAGKLFVVGAKQDVDGSWKGS